MSPLTFLSPPPEIFTEAQQYVFTQMETTHLSKEVKDLGINVAKLQTLMLDAVALLVHILEEAQRGTLTLKTATEAAGTALARLGNVSAHMTCDRRKRVLRDLNKDLLPLAEDKDAFTREQCPYFSVTLSRRE